MKRDLYTDAGGMQLIKTGEQLCGDKIVFRRNDDTSICVLADVQTYFRRRIFL